MFYDLNLSRTNTNQGIIQFKKLLECCLDQDYHTVAINRTFSDIILTHKQSNDYKPIPITRTSLQLTDTTTKTLHQLSRVTIQVSQTKNMQQLTDLNAKILQTYDLVAVKPKTQKTFHSLCTEYDYYDIITFDMGQKIPFMLKRSPVYQAIRKGKFFQITLGPLYDANKKRVCLTNCLNIIKATQGKNLIVSSDVSTTLYHRSGYDVCSLLVSLGLKKDEAYKCVTENPKKCVAAGKFKKSYKGTIEVVTEEQIGKMRSKQLVKMEKWEEMIREKDRRRKMEEKGEEKEKVEKMMEEEKVEIKE